MEKRAIPPTASPQLWQVIIYFGQKGLPEKIAEQFYEQFESTGWKSSKGTHLNWKKEAVNWIWKAQERTKKIMKILSSTPPGSSFLDPNFQSAKRK